MAATSSLKNQLCSGDMTNASSVNASPKPAAQPI
jgi:hypothetical protein